MRLELFEKSENLGPTILTEYGKIVLPSGISHFYQKFHFSKISKLNLKIRSYISYI